MANVISSSRLATMDAGSLSPGVDIMAILESGTVSGANIQAIRDRKKASDVTKSIGVAGPSGTVGGATPGPGAGAPGPGVTPAAAGALGAGGAPAFDPGNFITDDLRRQYMAAGPVGVQALAQVEALQDGVIAKRQAQKARTWDSIGAAGLALKDLSIADQDVALTRMASDSEGDPIAVGLLNQLGKIKDKDQRAVMWDRIINQAQGASEAIKNQIAATNAAAQTVSAAAQAASVPIKAAAQVTAAGKLAHDIKVDEEQFATLGRNEQIEFVSESGKEATAHISQGFEALSFIDQQMDMLKKFEAIEGGEANMGVLGTLAVQGAKLFPELGDIIAQAGDTPPTDILQQMRTSFNNTTLAKASQMKGSMSNRELGFAIEASANAMSSTTGVALKQLEDQRDVIQTTMAASQAEANAAQQALSTGEKSDIDAYLGVRNKRVDAQIKRDETIAWAKRSIAAGAPVEDVKDELRKMGISATTLDE